MSVDDVLATKMIADPLHVADCCLVTDAAGALILSSTPCSPSAAVEPVRVAGWGQAHEHITATVSRDLASSVAGTSALHALRMSELALADVDLLQLYDALTSQVIILLEDIGFCGKGEGGEFVSSGILGPKGGLPMNTPGGALSYTHPGMFGIFTLIEAYRQLSNRYFGLERAIEGRRTALRHAIMGYAGGSHASVVLTKGAV